MEGTSQNRFPGRQKCIDLLEIHKRVIYASSKVQLYQLGNLATLLKDRFEDKDLYEDDVVCDSCYDKLWAEVRFDDGEDDEESIQSSGEVFEPSNSQEVAEFSSDLTRVGVNISPLKRSSKITRHEAYVTRKRKEIIESLDMSISPKLEKLYDLEENVIFTKPFSDCTRCEDWFSNFNKALANCSSYREQTQLLTVAPIHSMPQGEILNNMPLVTMHMLKKARNLAKEKGIYATADLYEGNPIDPETIRKALKYFISDDYDCTRQSANKSDVKMIWENGEKVPKVKRFMIKSIRETYNEFKKANERLKIGLTKFYSVRPSWVVPQPEKVTCLCVQCTNFNLMVSGLKAFLSSGTFDSMDALRETILNAIVCSRENIDCLFGACNQCPGETSITMKLLRLEEEDEEQELTYATWENNDLIKKTTKLSTFLIDLTESTMKISRHLSFKTIQQKGIKNEKTLLATLLGRVMINGDFAENWAVIYQNAIQGRHWINDQISLFTAVCYFKESIDNFVVVSDDRKHDSAHALMALELIRAAMKEKYPDQITSETIVTDGAPSHFKNKNQFYEFSKSKQNSKWIYSATGHGKGAPDGLGASSKSEGTKHNLSCTDVNLLIKDAESFVKQVQPRVPKISLILLKASKVESFRKKKQKEWEKCAEPLPGIRETHIWQKVVNDDVNDTYTATTCEHALELIE